MAIDYTKRGPAQQPEQPPQPPAPPAPGVSLSKVTLTKAAPAVSLTKAASSGELRVNLSWTARPARSGGGGFLKRLAPAASIDLDLGCLFELEQGKGAVQALGNAFAVQVPGSARPVIRLDGDDRSGSGGENLLVDLSQLASIRRILVFAYIYEGVPNWAEADAVVTLVPADGPEVVVRLDEHDPRSRFVAIAMLENVGGELVVRREVRYVQGAQDALDEAYGFGLQWKAGRK